MSEFNVYYNPEHFDLEVIAEFDFSSGSYEFDKRVIWKDLQDGTLYTARHSGCSCPTPFEDYESKADLSEVRSTNWLIEEAREAAKSEYYSGPSVLDYIEELRCL